MRARPRTLARSLAVRVVAVAAAVLVLTSGANVVVLALVLDGRSDAQLSTSAAAVEQLTRDSRVEALRVARLRALAPAGTVVVALGDNEVAVSLSNEAIPDRDLARVAAAATPGTVTRIETAGAVFKVTAVDIRPLDVVTEGEERRLPADRIVLGLDVSDEVETVGVMAAVAAGILGAALIALAAAVALAVRRATRPLSRMAGAARRASTGDAEARLDIEGSVETRALAVAVNEALDARERLETRLRQFVADASHELRAPITTIQGWSELYLQADHADADAVATMERVEAEAARMRGLVDELALLARLDARATGARDPVDLAALAASVVEDARVVNPNRQLTLDLDGDAIVVGDADQLVRVLRNLVGNADQHSGPDARIRVGVTAEADDVVLVVRDDGVGIADADLPHVFERFYVADRRVGSGLGLPIARSIVVNHGGTITVESPARGTVVRVTLPRS